jgi:hypothetical protein
VVATWRVGVLPTGVENVVTFGCGEAVTFVDAFGAAASSLVAAVVTGGRQEYRLYVDDLDMMIVPGLTGDGLVDLEDLEEYLYREASHQAAQRA